MALARFWVTLVVLLAVLGLRSALWPQSNIDGAIGGAVTDPSGALVARASISARNVDTNERNAPTSDAQGAYRITHLRPGTYEVTINTTDFLAFRAERIIVELGRVTLLQARLEVGTRAEVVQVKGESPVIDTVHPELSNNINAGAISYMPINARRWSSLAFNTPATVPDGQFGILSFRGIAGMLNSNTVTEATTTTPTFPKSADERVSPQLSAWTQSAKSRSAHRISQPIMAAPPAVSSTQSRKAGAMRFMDC